MSQEWDTPATQGGAWAELQVKHSGELRKTQKLSQHLTSQFQESQDCQLQKEAQGFQLKWSAPVLRMT